MGEAILSRTRGGELIQIGVDKLETSFAWKQGPVGRAGADFSDLRNNWANGFHHGDALDSSPSDGIVVLKSGYYYVEAHQRVSNSNNGYIAISESGNRTTLENRDTGGWIHDHAGVANRFSHSKYIGYVQAGEKISAGVTSTNPSNMRWDSNQTNGFIFALKLDFLDGGFFSSVFMDYAWCGGAHSFNSAYKTNYNAQGGYGESLTPVNGGIKILKDGWYWFESGHRSAGSSMSTILS